ncbi:hypothetical protein [Actinoplanes sp. NPDC089786]|uniref:hypothetical protein n=1 Tax=Actinoplanes sp. NPDC089786 TaxID=3155185 RepID=UPI00342A5B6B
MTTQQQQPPQQPMYPTAPPWANPAPPPVEPAPPAYGTVTPWEAPYPQTGQLLVPYPEEMRNAARPTPPRWWPVVIWTFLFGILGAVSAARRANIARRGGNSTAPYWITWAATLAAGAVLWGVAAFAVQPVVLQQLEDGRTTQVEKNIRTDGALKGLIGVDATAVNCDPLSARDATGLRLYDCALTLDDGRTGTLVVEADKDSKWSVVRKKK